MLRSFRARVAVTELQPQYLRVTNYERYQHYKNRRPIWVKLHVELLDDYQLNKQKPQTRLLAMLLLLVAATHDNRIPHDPEWVAAKAGLPVKSTADSLATLVSIGFLVLAKPSHSASKTLARSAKAARPEVEVEKSRKPPSPPSGIRQKPADDACAECFCGGGLHIADCSLREVA